MADRAGLKCVATVEARMTSSRLPGKVLLPAGGRPLLEILVERLRRAPGLDGVVIATTVNAGDDPISALGEKLGVGVFRGSENDVLGRVCGALRSSGADVGVEITGDCPLIDPDIVGEALTEFLRTRAEHPYVSNSDPHRAVPAGLDVQVFFASALFQLEATTDDPEDREHVSYGFYRPESGDRWRPRFIRHAACVGAEELLATLDFPEDYDLIRRLHEDLASTDPHYAAADIVRWIRAHPELETRCREARTAWVR
ncbi:MAG TPA: glycosyltransferase family protein [Candidatus Binatia bacterium]|nr:glycosyltransferase family protein [Candidatus Binatia bacterium]